MATMQIERVCVSDSVKEVNDALASMPVGLFDMYTESLERMSKQPGTRYNRGLRILAWIAHSMRPPTVDELLHALLAEEAYEAAPAPRQLDRSSLAQPKVIVDVCAGLVAVEPNSRRVRLVHSTAREYLDQLDSD
jgi:ankyrin repeat domain-containing protein 50